MKDFRCQKCNKLLGRYRECRELEVKCPRCGYRNHYCKRSGDRLTNEVEKA